LIADPPCELPIIREHSDSAVLAVITPMDQNVDWDSGEAEFGEKRSHGVGGRVSM